MRTRPWSYVLELIVSLEMVRGSPKITYVHSLEVKSQDLLKTACIFSLAPELTVFFQYLKKKKGSQCFVLWAIQSVKLPVLVALPL